MQEYEYFVYNIQYFMYKIHFNTKYKASPNGEACTEGNIDSRETTCRWRWLRPSTEIKYVKVKVCI